MQYFKVYVMLTVRKKNGKNFLKIGNKRSTRNLLKGIALGLLFHSVTLIALPTKAQTEPDTTFNDDLLNRLVGKWIVTGTVHGMSSNQTLEAEWVLNHQFLRIYEKSKENVIGTAFPFEAVFYIGKGSTKGRYIFQLMTVFGGNEAGFGYGQRDNNSFKLVSKDKDITIPEKFSWEPKTNTWRIMSWIEQNGKREVPHIELIAKTARQ